MRTSYSLTFDSAGHVLRYVEARYEKAQGPLTVSAEKLAKLGPVTDHIEKLRRMCGV
jgi:hypothetical protein